MSEEQLIATLLAEEGKKPGQPIGTYTTGRKSWSLVFLPTASPIGQSVRVQLTKLEKTDSRGHALYRAVPAPVEYAERWKDNGDGTLSRVTIATDWLLQESEVGVMETRPSLCRDGVGFNESHLSKVIGQDLASSVITDDPILQVPLEMETVEDGQLTWKKIGQRPEPQPTETFPINRIEINTCEWKNNHLQINYDSNWEVSLSARYNRPESSWEQSYGFSATWAEMPAWWKAEQISNFPVCACGRERYNKSNPDGYAKCEICRRDERCVRCGKQTRVTQFDAGRLVCPACEKYENEEKRINLFFNLVSRQIIADQAKTLLAGEAVPKEAGEIILRATSDHLTDDWNRKQLLEKWSGYTWYYFTSEGVFGSKLSPAAMQAISFLPQATGNGLVEIVAWLFGYKKEKDCMGDYYWINQVIQGQIGIPTLSDDFSNASVATKLRGSEADRQKAIDRLTQLEKNLGKDDQRIQRIINSLNSSDQDYAKTLDMIAVIEKGLSRQNNGEILIRFGGPNRRSGSTDNRDYWVIRPDGSCREWDSEVYPRSHQRGTPTVTWELIEPDELALSWAKGCSASEHEFTVAKLPVGGCTKEQLRTVARLEDKLEDEWRGRHGLSSGEGSPSVGEGWGLVKTIPSVSQEPTPSTPSKPISEASISQLADFFARSQVKI